MAQLWITVHGFASANAYVEAYKTKNSIITSKKAALRKSLKKQKLEKEAKRQKLDNDDDVDADDIGEAEASLEKEPSLLDISDA